MYGCYNGYMVYGFYLADEYETMVPTANSMLSYEFCQKHQISQHLKELVRFYAMNFVYGKECELDEATGQPIISKTDKKIVDDLFKALENKLDVGVYRLGYHIVISKEEEFETTQMELPDPEL